MSTAQGEARGGDGIGGAGGGDRRGAPAARPAGAGPGPRAGGALAGVAGRDGVRVRAAQGPLLRGRAVEAPPPPEVGACARRRRAEGVGGGAGRQGEPRRPDEDQPPQELGGLAGLRVALLLDRLPLAQERLHRHPCPRRRRRRACSCSRSAAGGHGGRLVPRARMRRVLVPRAGVQPRAGRACRVRALLLRRAPPLRPAN
uniref:Uncharacterized protein n=1 Tax=Arundo donax TaxID=35708 RepID=A0A0A9D1G0_ARUDO